MSDQNPDREKLADEISGIVVGAGYESVSIGITAALEAADAILASDWLAEHDDQMRREAAAEQREKDAVFLDQIAMETFVSANGQPDGLWGATVRRSGAFTDAAAAIREQGTDADPS